MTRKKGCGGLTLIELIISVAVLAVTGLAVVSLFVFAHVNNQKATDLDHSVYQCTSIIEQIKASGDLSLIQSSDLFFDAAVSTDLSDMASCEIFYDDSWKRLNNVSSLEELEKKAEYKISVEVHEFSEQKGLLMIDVKSVRIKPYALSKKGKTEIFKLSSVMEAVSKGVAK